ncbi:MAG TPA: YciI family protein [Vicinamibacterales bacterium]|nr:YciI family protein [Vicinamibacterales bacterium]
MKYMLLIHNSEQALNALSEGELKQMMADFRRFSEEIRASGQYQAGSQLQPTSLATSVRVRNGKRLVTDGPFAETREQLGGYYLVEAKDLDEAIGLAERVPSVKIGTIEIRPLVETPTPAVVQ